MRMGFMKYKVRFVCFVICAYIKIYESKVLKHFTVIPTMRIDLSPSGRTIDSVRSLSDCASICSADDNCCTGSFDVISRVCWIDTCCRPSISNSASGVVYMKRSKVPRHCGDILLNNPSGIYTIYPNDAGIQVFCDMETECKSWIVFQRRNDGSEDFYRTWQDYKVGFGNLQAEFWLGNENIHTITTNGSYILRIDMTDFNGVSKHAFYSDFFIGDDSTEYQLHGSNLGGDAGDSLSWLIGRKFSTKDNDNDEAAWSCAIEHKGAWWYADCTTSNLNGFYQNGITDKTDGVFWYTFHKNLKYSLKTSKMMIRKV